jgi:hypothetical protein
VPPEYDYLLRDSRGHVVRAMKPDDGPLPKQGYGGHPVGARPKRRSLTVYQGRQPFTLEVPMVLWRDGESVERDRMALDEMASSEGDTLGQEPPTVVIEAKFPLPVPDALGTRPLWWIEDIVWGKEFRNSPHAGGDLTYKEVTVTLLERSAPDVVIHGGEQVKLYRVKRPGDTLTSILNKHHMDLITFRQLNPSVRSDANLRNGMTVRVTSFTPFTVQSREPGF